MMSELVPGQVKSFSIGFDDPSFDESKYAEMVANHLGTEHRMMRLEPRTLLDLVPSYRHPGRAYGRRVHYANLCAVPIRPPVCESCISAGMVETNCLVAILLCRPTS